MSESRKRSSCSAASGCDQDCVAKRTIYDFLVADVSFLQTAKTVVQGITETVSGGGLPPGTASTNAKDFVLRGGSYAPDGRSYDALLATKITQRDAFARQVAACQAECQSLANAALTAQNTVNSALSVERAALAAVYAVCPTFDPTPV